MYFNSYTVCCVSILHTTVINNILITKKKNKATCSLSFDTRSEIVPALSI